jgi:hypothetical protein
MSGTPDPYYELSKSWAAVKVRVRTDLGDDAGHTVWLPDGSTEIHLAHDLTRVERQCTLAHEIVHLRRGQPCESNDAADEAATRRDTARWLIGDLTALGQALNSYDVAEVARRLDVIPAIVYDRLDHLTKFEMAHLRSAMTQLDGAVV